MGIKTEKVTTIAEFDVRNYVTGALTDANIDDAIDDAWADANAFVTGSGLSGRSATIVVPAGKWTLARAHVFPASGTYQMPVNFEGAGMNETVFRVDTDVGHTPVFTFGTYDADPSPLPHTFYLRVSGFSIIGNVVGDGPCNRIGLRFYAPVVPVITDIRVRGLYDESCQWFEGHALQLLESLSEGVAVNSQFPEITNCDFFSCMVGIYATQAGPINMHNVHSQGMKFRAAILEGYNGTWSSSGIQNNFADQHPDAWFGNRYDTIITSGWNSTVGLPSGTGATCGAQSGRLCTVTGLSGLDTDPAQRGGAHRDMFLELIPAGNSANELKVRGVYKIEEILSATSCTIRKGSNHTSQGSLSWQVRQGAYTNNFTLDRVYNEADGSKALLGLYKCVSGARSSAILKGCFFSSSGPVGSTYVEAQNCNRIEVIDIQQRANMPYRTALLTRVAESLVYDVRSRIYACDMSFAGLVCRQDWRSIPNLNDPGITSQGWWTASGGHSVRIRSALAEMGFVECWDARVASSVEVSGFDVVDVTGVLNSQILTPRYATPPVYAAADPGLGPVIATVPGAGTAGGSLVGTISAGLTPQNDRFSVSIVVIGRLGSATPGPADPFRIMVSQSGGGQAFIGLNDGQYFPSGMYYGSGPASGVARLNETCDTNAHVMVLSTAVQENYAASANFPQADGSALDYTRLGSYLFDLFLPNTALDIAIGGAGTNTYDYKFALVAVKCGPLSPLEHRKIVDMAKNEWPLPE